MSLKKKLLIVQFTGNYRCVLKKPHIICFIRNLKFAMIWKHISSLDILNIYLFNCNLSFLSFWKWHWVKCIFLYVEYTSYNHSFDFGFYKFEQKIDFNTTSIYNLIIVNIVLLHVVLFFKVFSFFKWWWIKSIKSFAHLLEYFLHKISNLSWFPNIFTFLFVLDFI